MLKIIVDKPSAGGDRGHLCESCKSGYYTAGNGWESYRCAAFDKSIDRIVTTCSEYNSKKAGGNAYDAPIKLLNLAWSRVVYDGHSFFLDRDRFEVWQNVYDHDKRLSLIEKWGFARNDEAAE